jgi:prepilin-type N-terminal cleavage/methylation domain-containing protein
MIAKRAGFTLVELLLALMIASILVTMTAGVYTLFRRSLAAQQVSAELAQNGRVVIDRLSRELRQSPLVVTNLPDTPTDNSVVQPGQIEFESGHDTSLTYYRYYVSGTILKLETKYYYYSAAPSTRVRYTPTSPVPLSAVLSTVDVADRVKSLNVYGDPAVRLVLTTTDGNLQNYVLDTTVLRRN